jgi:hypothetical protein
VDRVDGSGGPQPGGGLRVHGGPRAATAERLIGARARGRSGEQKLCSPAVGKNEEETSGVPTVGEDGRCGAGGRPAMVR